MAASLSVAGRDSTARPSERACPPTDCNNLQHQTSSGRRLHDSPQLTLLWAAPDGPGAQMSTDAEVGTLTTSPVSRGVAPRGSGS